MCCRCSTGVRGPPPPAAGGLSEPLSWHANVCSNWFMLSLNYDEHFPNAFASPQPDRSNLRQKLFPFYPPLNWFFGTPTSIHYKVAKNADMQPRTSHLYVLIKVSFLLFSRGAQNLFQVISNHDLSSWWKVISELQLGKFSFGKVKLKLMMWVQMDYIAMYFFVNLML